MKHQKSIIDFWDEVSFNLNILHYAKYRRFLNSEKNIVKW